MTFGICDNGGGGSGGYATGYDYAPATGSDGGGSGPGGGSNPKYPTPDPCQLGYEPDGTGGCILNISGYLSPVNSGDNVNQTYDGMQAAENNGVIYTFNAEINAWLMPDLQVLFENGYEFNSSGEIDLDGAVLSTVVGFALVEPTPFGEIIVGGVVLTVWIYNIVNADTTHYHQGCIDKYVECVEYTWWYDCDFCLENCNAQNGVWNC